MQAALRELVVWDNTANVSTLHVGLWGPHQIGALRDIRMSSDDEVDYPQRASTYGCLAALCSFSLPRVKLNRRDQIVLKHTTYFRPDLMS